MLVKKDIDRDMELVEEILDGNRVKLVEVGQQGRLVTDIKEALKEVLLHIESTNDVENLEDELEGLEDKLEGLEGVLEDRNSEVEEIEGKLSKVEQELQSKEVRIENLEDELTKLRDGGDRFVLPD